MKHYWIIFFNDNILLEKLPNGNYSIPLSEESPVALPQNEDDVFTLPELDGHPCLSFEVGGEIAETERYVMTGLRASYDLLPQSHYQMGGKAHELLYWNASTRFCGTCGAPMKKHTDISKVCTSCGKEIWPVAATAIIVLIRREDKILLVRAHNFRSNFHGLVAGFLETGESLEECVKREVLEETGLKVKNISYFKSQPWPYPCGLMAGFTADYESGEISIQEEELAEAGWYSRDNLPTIPRKLSMARMLIDNWLENQ